MPLRFRADAADISFSRRFLRYDVFAAAMIAPMPPDFRYRFFFR